jgi:Helix-turn-helix domain
VDDELTPAQFDALMNEEDGDREILVALLNERVARWPWWDSSWRVIEIREVRARQLNRLQHRVVLNGVAGRDTGETLPLSFTTRVWGPGRVRFEVRVVDAGVGASVRDSDPHPFGLILCALMDRRGLSRKDVAHHCGLAQSTVAKMMAGYMVPREPGLLAGLAAALTMPVGDLRAIAGLPEDVGE